jgi:hypothetical protein
MGVLLRRRSSREVHHPGADDIAQPPAWLRHQTVEVSAWAMVSITWRKVRGSVSMPFDAHGQQRAEQSRLMELVEQGRRQPARVLDLV